SSINVGLSLSLALLFAVLLFAVLLFATPLLRPELQTTTRPNPGMQSQSAKWQEIDRLVPEQKFQAALEGVEKIRVAAQQSADRDEWTRALIREVQLRMGLHGYETAVRFL